VTTAWRIPHIRETLVERCPVRTRLVISKETFEQAVKDLYGARKMMWGTWQKLMAMKPPLVRMRMRSPYVNRDPSQMIHEYSYSMSR
jgi:hypothetical protein